MSRISEARKSNYRPINPDSEQCYYCDDYSIMDDLTPHPKAVKRDLDMFMEPWTRARVCRSCWGKIYTTNVVNGGVKYGAMRGCMTLANKQHLLRRNEWANTEYKSPIGRVFDEWLAPLDIVKSESGTFIFKGLTIFEEELLALQPAFYCRIYAPERLRGVLAMKSLRGAYASDELDFTKEALYLEMLDLEGYYENDQTTSEDPGSETRWEPEPETSPDGPSDMVESSRDVGPGWL